MTALSLHKPHAKTKLMSSTSLAIGVIASMLNFAPVLADTVIVNVGETLVGPNNSGFAGLRDDYVVNGTLNVTGETSVGTLSGAGLVNISGGIMSSLTVESSSDGVFSGEITGDGILHKYNSGSLTLTGDNSSYNGYMALYRGKVIVGHNKALGASFFVSGTSAEHILVIEDNINISNDLWLQNYTLGVSAAEGEIGTISGILKNGGGLEKVDAGTIILSGTNTYSGGTVLTEGTLVAGTNDAFGSGTFTLSGSADKTIGLADGVTINKSIALTSNLNVSAGAGESGTLSGFLTGSNGITKKGDGTITLTADNSYNGTTVVDAGVLALSVGAKVKSTNRVIVNSDGEFQVAGSNFVGSIEGSGDINILSGGSMVIYGNGLSTEFSGKFTGPGGFNKLNSQNLTLSGDNSATNTNFILTYGKLIIGHDDAIGSNQLILTNNSYSKSLEILNDIDLGTAINIGITGDLNLTSSGAQKGTISGVMSGTGGVNKTGSGSLALDAANTYDGTTTLIEGTLVAGNNAAFSSGAFVLSGSADKTLGLKDGVTINKNIALTSDLNVSADSGASGVLSGWITGAGVLTKTGAGSVELSRSNAYSGGTVLKEGTLVFGFNGAFGSGGLSLSGSADKTLEIKNTMTLVGNVALTSDLNVKVDTSGAATFAGVFSGASDLTKKGTGALSLSGANTHTGDTVVDEGTLVLKANSLSNATSVKINTGGVLKVDGLSSVGSVEGDGDILLAADLKSGFNNNDTVLNGKITGSGDFGKWGTGSLTLNGDNDFAANTGVILNEGKLILGHDDALGQTSNILKTDVASDTDKAIKIADQVNIGNFITLQQDLSIEADENHKGTLYGAISGAGGLVKTGAGRILLSGVNSHAGGTVLKEGTLVAGTNAAFGSGAFTLSGSADKTLELADNISINKNIALTSDLNIENGSGHLSTLTGGFSGSHNLVKKGDGEIYLMGANTYTGNTIVEAGSLGLSGGAAIADTAKLTVKKDSQVRVGNDETVETFELLGGTVIGTSGLTATYFSQTSVDSLVQTTIVAQNKVKAIDGGIAQNNSEGVKFTGTASDVELVLKSNVNYLVNAAPTANIALDPYVISGTSSGGKVTLDNAAVLTGKIQITGSDYASSKFTNTGTWNAAGGASTFEGAFENNGILNLQNGAANDSVNVGDLTLGSASKIKLDIDKNDNTDVINVTGSVVLGGELDIMATGALGDYTAGKNYKYTLIANDGTDAVTGDFTNVTDNFAFLNAKVEKNTDGANDVKLSFSVAEAPTGLDFKPFSDNETEKMAAVALDGFDYTSDEGKEIYNKLVGFTTAQAKETLKQVSGADHGSASSLSDQSGTVFQNSMMTRAGGGGGVQNAPQAVGFTASNQVISQTDNNVVWADLVAMRSSIKASNNFGAVSAFSSGMTFGGKIAGGDDWTVGASAGYISTNFSTINAASKSTSSSLNVGLYGGWGSVAADEAGLGVMGALSYGLQHYKTSRIISAVGLGKTAVADYYGSTISGELKARYGFDNLVEGTDIVVAPFVGAGFSRSHTNAYTETGAGAFNITAGATNVNKFNSLVGVEISNKFEVEGSEFNGSLSAAWKHEFGDVSTPMNYKLAGAANAFAVQSAAIARDSLQLNATLGVQLDENSTLSFSAMADISQTSLNYGAAVSFKMRF
ncbi:MAG: autotransporter-associated beta strand repeat-containing protein [Hyphomicrobiales bacterium]